MAPEFFPLFAFAGLVVASLVACGVLAWAAFFAPWAQRALIHRFPLPARAIKPLLVLVLLGTIGLLAITASCGHNTYQQFLLNEPMASAAREGDLARVRSYLDRGASPDSWGIDYVNPAIVEAAMSGNVKVVDLLLARGADPNVKNIEGKSAIQVATERGYAAVVKRLRWAGAKE